eukprot:COSAG06_NODE_38242_length_425_cov_3.920245_1_plen_27_part_10
MSTVGGMCAQARTQYATFTEEHVGVSR